jgi:flagellar motor switch protein FliN/FliY
MSDIAHEQANALILHFADASSFVLSQIAGTPLEARPAVLEDAIEDATLIRIEICGALSGLCEVAISADMTSQFAALLTGEAPDPSAEISSDTREAATELIQQICGNAADRLRRAFGPMELRPHLAASRDVHTGVRQRMLISHESDSLEFEFHIVRLAVAQHAEAPGAQPPTAQPERTSGLPASNRNLDILLDIELGATLRFGTCQMLLKDILEICSGSVVELDRRVQEPVDLLIDGRVIAQGEVVIVEGNYGLRILQVAAPGEKIACLPSSR